MKPIRDIKISYSDWHQGVWPLASDFNNYETISYSKSDHALMFSKHYSNDNRYREIFNDTFCKRHPDAGPIPEDLKEELIKYSSKLRERALKASNHRYFINSIMKGEKMDEVLKVTAYLEGSLTECGGQLKVEQEYLKNYSEILLKRIGPQEFIMGQSLSLNNSGGSPVGPRVMTVVMKSKAKFWPSNLYMPEIKMTNDKAVFSWCLQRLKIAQIKMPTARLYKEAYDSVHAEAYEIYTEALTRWPGKVEKDLAAEVEALHESYGNIPKMKEYNSGLRMQYELTK